MLLLYKNKEYLLSNSISRKISAPSTITPLKSRESILNVKLLVAPLISLASTVSISPTLYKLPGVVTLTLFTALSIKLYHLM